jgi:DNA-directed RNA polymerase subunit M/transcription elongation factor TFIIS
MILTTTNHPVRECPNCREDMEKVWIVVDEDTDPEKLIWKCSECGYEEEIA